MCASDQPLVWCKTVFVLTTSCAKPCKRNRKRGYKQVCNNSPGAAHVADVHIHTYRYGNVFVIFSTNLNKDTTSRRHKGGIPKGADFDT